MSGISAHDECVEAYQAFKLQNSSKGEKFRYIIFRIMDEQIKIAEKGAHSKTWEDFVEAMAGSEKEGAYGLFDYHAEGDDGRQYDKVIFVQWSPDSLPVRAKMLYGSTAESFKGTLGTGIAHSVQASDISDLDEDDIHKLVVKG